MKSPLAQAAVILFVLLGALQLRAQDFAAENALREQENP
jgi:hypothetical protein